MSAYQRKIKTFTVTRPWGHFDQFTKNERTTVKIHFIKPHSAMSWQYHHHRAEFWRIISGHPTIIIGRKKTKAKPGDEFMVKRLEKHRIETKNDAVRLLEIAYGDFDEGDIIRIEDKYGRVQR